MAVSVANHNFSRCPRCGSRTRPATALIGESEFWLECSNPECRTFINTYIPQAHQVAFHKDNHKITANFGGYGSGKTLTDREELEKHILITEKGTTLVGANVASQFEQTLKRDFEADFPKEFYTNYNNQKQYADFANGHRLIYRPYDDPDKLRSYNLSMWIILEASEVKEESFTQLKTRLRNMAAATQAVDEDGNLVFETLDNGQLVPVYAHDWRRGIVESNPSAGWIKTDVLNASDVIKTFGETHEDYAVLESERDEHIATYITATSANKYLPKDFVQMQIKNKPAWWVERYIYGSFLYSDGLVYPSLIKYVCKTFEVPRKWKRICAFDYGLADASCFLFGAIDEMNNLLYIYKEVYANDRNIEELAKLFINASKDIPVGGWVCAPIIDPKSGPRRDYNKKTLADGFLDYGISFIPGQTDREARVFRTNTYIESGRVRIMDCCVHLIEQGRELKFKENPSSTTKPWRNEPEDKNDHAVVCLEWITMELPKDPNKLLWGAYNHSGELLPECKPEEERHKLDNEWAAAALSDNPDTTENNYYYSDYRFN